MLSNIEKIQKEMNEFAKSLYPKLKLEFDHSSCGGHSVSGTYSSTRQKISLKWDAILNNYITLEKNNPKYTLEKLAWIVLVHEIGHHADYTNDKFRTYLASQNDMMDIVISGNKYDVKKAFRNYHKEIVSVETRAWDYGEEFLPPFIDKDLFYQYKERCLKSYINGFKSMYRSFYIKAGIANCISEILDSNPDYGIHFDDHGNSRLSKRENIYYLNISNKTKRNRSYVHSKSAAKKLSVEIFDNLLELEKFDFPFFMRSIDELTNWEDKEKIKIDRNIQKIVSTFCYDKKFIELYREIKEDELYGISLVKRNYLEISNNKILV